MSCYTAACQGFVNCQKELNCPVGRCLQEYKPPPNLPENIDNDSFTMAFINQGSGTAITPMEIEYDDGGLVTETIGTISWEGPSGITDSMYLMNVRHDTLVVQENQDRLFYGQGIRNAVMIFYQDPANFQWFVWQCLEGQSFPGYTNSREYVKMIPLLTQPGGADTPWILNPAVFSATSPPTLVDKSYLFFLWDVADPLQNSNSPLLFGTTVAIQSVDLVNSATGCTLNDAYNCDDNSWIVKGNEQIFGNNNCVFSQPMLMAHSRDEIQSVGGANIGTGTTTNSAPFCGNVDCYNDCMLAYFMITENNGCLPALVDSGEPTSNDDSYRNMWITVGVLVGVSIILLVLWLIVATKFRT